MARTAPDYSLALSILDRALTAEARREYDDTAVKGGLDRLLLRLHRERRLPPGEPLSRAVADLARTSYASLPPAGRAHWVQSLTGLLRRRATEAASAPRRTPSAPVAPATPVPPRRVQVKPAARVASHRPEEPVTALSSINARVAAKLATLGVTTIGGLLYQVPHRYDDYSTLRPIAQLVPGEQQTLIATVWSAAEKQIGRVRKATELICGDTSGNLRAVFFNQPYLARQLPTGATVVLSGKVTVFQHQLQMDSPEWELLQPSELERAIHTGRLVPVYPLTAGLSARTLRRATSEAIDSTLSAIEESLPAPVRERNHLLPLREAIRQIHFPESHAMAAEARRRLAFEELLSLQLAVLDERRQRQDAGYAPPLVLDEPVRRGFLESLPFALTAAQERVSAEVAADLMLERPMARLLQGDVGSGKTVIAALALLAAVSHGLQGVLMAPTEILAEQHFQTLCRLFGAGSDAGRSIAVAEPPYLDRSLRIGLLHGGMGGRARTAALRALAAGEVDIAVGTQALIQEGVQIPRLGLAIVDEQHRFGVLQRATLREKGLSAHLLVMTATPIPRTLALTLYGDLEVSVLDELPPGRQPVTTRFYAGVQQDEFVHRFVRDEVDAGRQAFVICPLVEESESLEAKAAVDEYERLRGLDVFEGVAVGLLHGRMKPAEKDAIMRDFAEGRVQVLVSTAVVEVGIDVPNASVIVIEGADRFGLAQLHQFRGRVGRGSSKSYCLLLAENASPEAGERLRLMEQTQDGFELAEADLRLRGPGEYFGTRQSGLPDLRVARLTDVPMLNETRLEAARVLEAAPNLDGEAWQRLREQMEQIKSRGGELS